MYRPGCCHIWLLPVLLNIFNIFHQCQRILCLTIDNHLTIVANDCYGRVSIGSKLPDMDNVLEVDAVSLTECKESCRNDRNGCDAFSFGVGLKGNSTCLISPRVPALENLEIHPEYDVYVRKRHDALWCDFDRLYYGSLPRGSGNRSGSRSSTDVKRIKKKERVSITGNLFSKLIRTSMPALIPLDTSPFFRNKEDIEDHRHIGLDSNLFIDHDQNRRILDIVANKNDKTVSASPLGVGICHRKLLPGKKMMELLVERVVSCENLQDCCRACDYEKTFVCKGFNHRRRTDDSKCICELTSTPHFRMDVDEDFSVDSHYDYYEKNENCQPSILYGNNLPPRSKDRIKSYREASDRSTYEEIYLPNGESIFGYPKGTLVQFNKRLNYEEAGGGFASRRNAASNWNLKWKNADASSTGNTFSNSPVNYDKEYLDVKPSIFSESPVKQNRGDFYGKFDYYGDAFGYNANSYLPVAKASQMTRKCSTKAVSGSKLSRSVLRKTCLSQDFDQCEDFCINEMSFSCQSFAYRYNVVAANPTDNCLLSDLSYRDLNFYTDLEPDRDYDSYVSMSDTKMCDLKKSANRYPSEECFSRIKSGFAMPMDIAKKSVFANDLGECQFACTASQQFLCRSFVFKYGGKNRGRDHDHDHDHDHEPFNCFLSDWPSEEMNPGNMPDMDGAELYERNIFSYGCEIYPSTSFSNGKRISPTSYATDELCYSEHHRPCKLMPHAIVSSMRALTKSECREKCSTMRNTATIPCMSFNYLISIDGGQDNCFLSDISRGDLRPNLDYVRDDDHMLYTWKELDPLCGIAAAFEKYGQSQSSVPSTFNDRNTQRTLEDDGSYIYRPIFHSSTVHSEKKFQSNYNNRELPNGNGKSTFNSASSEHEPNFLYSSQLSPFRRYTVNGEPCRNGTVCQRNEITGFWSCETENEYAGNWDYCCEPNHQCGFSQGYHYPWCYVGSNEDQWRPCSETYNPYYSPKDRSIYRHRQSPLYTARHWPVIYFHETSPPNCSINDP